MKIIREVIRVRLNVKELRTLIANKVVEIRKNLKMTQQEMADACEISRPSIINMEQGKQNISIEHLYKVAIVGKQNVKDLIPEIDYTPVQSQR